VPIVLKSGSLNLLEPYGPVQDRNGIVLPLPLTLPYILGPVILRKIATFESSPQRTCSEGSKLKTNHPSAIPKISLILLHQKFQYRTVERHRIPVGERISAPVRTDPGAHPASYTMGTGSFPGVKRPGRSADHPPTPSAEVKEIVELYLYSPSGSS
jgi:hypothetical protein